MTSIPILLSFQGKSIPLEGITTETTSRDLYQKTLEVLEFDPATTSIKLLAKGKRLPHDEDDKSCGGLLLSQQQRQQLSNQSDVQQNTYNTINMKPIKLIVMATSTNIVAELATKRSDPTIRGLDMERQRQEEQQQQRKQGGYLPWGIPHAQQDKNYKFCRFEACTWQSFGHRVENHHQYNDSSSSSSTPHDFAAMQLLERLALDPGVVAVLKERELVVGTLGEMDPIDDRIMKKHEEQVDGSCLLGYNTNGGARIDIKLRTNDLKGFRPYQELVGTLLHELSHNWVSDHNLLFWTNYGQMRAEYLTRHRALQSDLVNGKTTAELAGLDKSILERIPETILNELVRDMTQHGLHPQMIEGPIRQRCQELEQKLLQGRTVGGETEGPTSTMIPIVGNPRERALAAAEQRRKKQQQQQQQHEKDASSSHRDTNR